MTMGDRIKRKTRNNLDEVNGNPPPLGQPLSATPQSTGAQMASPPADRAGTVPGPANHP